MRMGFGLGLAAMLATVLAGGMAVADVPVETAKLKGQLVTLHIYPFLTEDELMALRLVKTNKQALQIFVTSKSGYAAMAVAPKEGFVRDGGLVPSVLAIGDLPTAEAAAEAALKGCNAARKGGEPCVVVLEVGPAG